MQEFNLHSRFDTESTVCRLNAQLHPAEDLTRYICAVLENSIENYEWLLGGRREGDTYTLDHLFPVELYLSHLDPRAAHDQAFIESLPAVYPLVFEFRSGYMCMSKPLAPQYGLLYSEFVDDFCCWLVEHEDKLIWDHGYAECGGVGGIRPLVYSLLEPDEPIIGFYRVDVNLKEKAWAFITPQGLILTFDDGAVVTVDKADFRNPQIPLGMMAFSALKLRMIEPHTGEQLKFSLSPEDMDELEPMRNDCHAMLNSPEMGRPMRMRDANALPQMRFLKEEDNPIGPHSARKREAYFGQQAPAVEGNPFGAPLRNPFAGPEVPRPQDNPFA
ncbi:hypothetical protein [Corynebacterium sp.]|uniref:hypothetical protein n=1 Tax=Corynebacterium sp. TaxID=1720 RepID=UPI0026DB071A|nr:hypothetical protein [Corynebacterium sp.]MDO5032702.1 hypothetical protein [Corynebacterium sp.]